MQTRRYVVLDFDDEVAAQTLVSRVKSHFDVESNVHAIDGGALGWCWVVERRGLPNEGAAIAFAEKFQLNQQQQAKVPA